MCNWKNVDLTLDLDLSYIWLGRSYTKKSTHLTIDLNSFYAALGRLLQSMSTHLVLDLDLSCIRFGPILRSIWIYLTFDLEYCLMFRTNILQFDFWKHLWFVNLFLIWGCEGLLTPDNPSGGENAFRSGRNGGVLVIAGRLGSKMEIRSPRIPTLAGFGRLLGNLFLGPRYAICLVFCEICKIST